MKVNKYQAQISRNKVCKGYIGVATGLTVPLNRISILIFIKKYIQLIYWIPHFVSLGCFCCKIKVWFFCPHCAVANMKEEKERNDNNETILKKRIINRKCKNRSLKNDKRKRQKVINAKQPFVFLYLQLNTSWIGQRDKSNIRLLVPGSLLLGSCTINFWIIIATITVVFG